MTGDVLNWQETAAAEMVWPKSHGGVVLCRRHARGLPQSNLVHPLRPSRKEVSSL